MVPLKKTKGYYTVVAAIAGLLLMGQISCAGTLRDRFAEKRLAESGQTETAFEEDSATMGSLPAGARVVRDIAYGSDEKQRFDVYIPRDAKNAPVIFMVHGGAWFIGDKASKSTIESKVHRWLPRGFVVVSPNYPLVPDTDPLKQASDLARALATAQEKAATWGADRTKFILMGHSAGAHLVALLATKPAISQGIVSTPWLGTVSLDSAALNVVEIMEGKHYRFYDRAFGKDPAYWKAASPFHALSATTQPILMTCSTKRADACPQAQQFAAKAKSLGIKTGVVEKAFSHKEMNALLGTDPGYTAAVEEFLSGLDGAVAAALAKR